MSGPPPVPPPLSPEEAAETNLPRILGILSTLQFLAVLVVGLRFYVRFKLIRSVGRDDWTMGAATVCALGGWAIFIFQGVNGLGRHKGALDPEQLVQIDMGTFLFSIINSSIGVALLKVSIALNLLRLSTNRWFAISLWCSIAFVSAYSFLGVMTFLLYCEPMDAYWNKTIPGAKCYSVQLFIAFALLNSTLNIFTDVLFASFPIPIIWKLQMKRKTKFYLIGVLSLGYIAVVMGIMKSEAQINYSPFADNTFDSWITFWASAQINIGIIAACTPSLKPLVSKALNLSSYAPNNYASGQGSQSRGTRRGNMSHPSRPRRDEYGLEELESRGSTPTSQDPDFGGKASARTTTTIYTGGRGADRSGSEEMILSEPSHAHAIPDARITKTTQITVQ
ncbi:hypothetical protein F5X68DRAFT_224209 [Plectosphaerella plurivora]|uniref:Rhodopsin domain-containing protein n=1 Tax=Plectosphaerella plurivora TaxID=936078 RepID=A0A9P8V5J9_9PEZI|nr:hypothetical protein F5X68DRAFT_224209 [Plectosphaerella plurivora]